ncbi:calcium-binding protein [Streptomyces capitiformicae]|uniref:Calcium-binding protein n=1 Tax=Streptomyces capitiformicae TaxID=2014920 RepID=A0A918ZTB1_9ACTN|nr:calcium-binding protein [Streptomyces capitiformicae]GHE69325.1 hypothetical protein GCM10017771_93110 [Streptomyces capitiformicae]
MTSHTRRVVTVALSCTLAGAALTAAPAAHAAPDADDITINSVVVNGGKPVVVGTKAPVKFPIAVTATHASGVYRAAAYLYGSYAYLDSDHYQLDCSPRTKPTTTCSDTYTLDPVTLFYQGNSPAGTWTIQLHVDAWDATYSTSGKYTFKVLRAARLTADAAPEPVKKGKTVTVKGALTRADWKTHKYAGFKGQSVKLQFRKKGSSTFTTLKTVKTGTGGAVKATTTATSDGYYRFVFGGTGTTATVTSGSDFIDVR